jgi:NAD-dependent deacetylase
LLRARTESAAATCDLLIAVGTSLTVYPAARLPEIAVDAGARFVIVNAEPTPLDGLAHVVLRGGAGDLLSSMVAPAIAPA